MPVGRVPTCFVGLQRSTGSVSGAPASLSEAPVLLSYIYALMHTLIFALRRYSRVLRPSRSGQTCIDSTRVARDSIDTMGRYRALMTDTDREHITGENNPTQNQKDQSVYRVRQRIREELPQDIKILREHRPDVFEELKEIVCEGD